MEKIKHSSKKEFDLLFSKLNALEVSSTDNYQKSLIAVLKMIAENQSHAFDEFEHLKKAIDLITVHMFKIERKVNS